MRRLAAILALWALLPAHASAQAVIPPRTGPMIPAQGQSNAARGITVTGFGTRRVPATSARIALVITTGDRSLALNAESLAPIVDALVNAGVDRNDVHLPPNFAAPGGSNIATITATVSNPTVERMQNGIVSVGTTIASLKNLALSNATVQLNAANCANALDGVRDDAVKNARAKAESLAKDLGVQIGSAINVTSFDQIGPDGSCSAAYNVNGAFNPQGPQGPSDYVTVPVTANVTITFAIK